MRIKFRKSQHNSIEFSYGEHHGVCEQEVHILRLIHEGVEFIILNDNSDVIKIRKYKIKKISVVYSKVALLKYKITCYIFKFWFSNAS